MGDPATETKKTLVIKPEAPAVVRFRVLSPAGKPIAGATITLDTGTPLTGTTDATGVAELKVPQTDIAALKDGQVVVHAKKRHHGPDPGRGKQVVPGGGKTTVTLD